MRSPYCGGNLVIFHEFAAVFIRANTVVRFEAEDNRTRDQSWRPTSKPPPGPGSGTKQLVRNEASPRPLWCAPSCGQKRAPLAVGASAALRAGLRALRLHPCQCCGRRAQAAAQRCRSVGHVWQCREEPPGGTCESHRKAVASTSDALGGAWCAACVREPGSRAVWPSWQSAADMRVAGGREGGEMLAAEDADYERTLQGGDRHPGPRFSASAHVEGGRGPAHIITLGNGQGDFA